MTGPPRHWVERICGKNPDEGVGRANGPRSHAEARLANRVEPEPAPGVYQSSGVR